MEINQNQFTFEEFAKLFFEMVSCTYSILFLRYLV